MPHSPLAAAQHIQPRLQRRCPGSRARNGFGWLLPTPGTAGVRSQVAASQVPRQQQHLQGRAWHRWSLCPKEGKGKAPRLKKQNSRGDQGLLPVPKLSGARLKGGRLFLQRNTWESEAEHLLTQ